MDKLRTLDPVGKIVVVMAAFLFSYFIPFTFIQILFLNKLNGSEIFALAQDTSSVAAAVVNIISLFIAVPVAVIVFMWVSKHPKQVAKKKRRK